MFLIGLGILIIFCIGAGLLLLIVGVAIPKFKNLKKTLYIIGGLFFAVPVLFFVILKIADLRLQFAYVGDYKCVCKNETDLKLNLDYNSDFELIQSDNNALINNGTWYAWVADAGEIIDFNCEQNHLGQSWISDKTRSTFPLTVDQVMYSCQKLK